MSIALLLTPSSLALTFLSPHSNALHSIPLPLYIYTVTAAWRIIDCKAKTWYNVKVILSTCNHSLNSYRCLYSQHMDIYVLAGGKFCFFHPCSYSSTISWRRKDTNTYPKHENTPEWLGMGLNVIFIMAACVRRWPLPIAYAVTWPIFPTLSLSLYLFL